jgi:phosphate transport system substrate-binding protein
VVRRVRQGQSGRADQLPVDRLGGGIRQFSEGTVDFGASDMPMTDEQIGKFKNKPLHFPTVLGGMVPTYNLPGVTQD